MTWSQPAFEAVAHLVGAHTGHAFPPDLHAGVEAGIRRAMERAGVTDPARYHDLVAADGNALDDLIVELTVGETYFFREPAQFEFIRREVLPAVRRQRGPDHVLRTWSAGCASGEEAYSLAILCAQEGLADRAYILATDISRAALAKAARAVYGDWSLRGEGAALAGPYLVRDGNRYRLDDRIRRRVTLAHLNLALDVYPSFATGTWGMDLILCRNVLIYFAAETVQTVARRLYDALAEGGWLLTGSSDPPLADKAPYETVVTDDGVFYRRSAVHQPSRDRQEAAAGHADREGPVHWPGGESAEADEPDRSLTVGPLKASGETADALAEARAAFDRGDYGRAVRLTQDLGGDPAAAALHVRALANLDTPAAERACAAATARHPLAAELAYLHAALLLERGRDEEAVRALRRVLYLDRALAIAHLTLGSLLYRRGDLAGARRSFRNAHDLCAARPADEPVPLADGERAGRLAEAAEIHMKLLDPSSR